MDIWLLISRWRRGCSAWLVLGLFCIAVDPGVGLAPNSIIAHRFDVVPKASLVILSRLQRFERLGPRMRCELMDQAV